MSSSLSTKADDVISAPRLRFPRVVPAPRCWRTTASLAGPLSTAHPGSSPAHPRRHRGTTSSMSSARPASSPLLSRAPRSRRRSPAVLGSPRGRRGPCSSTAAAGVFLLPTSSTKAVPSPSTQANEEGCLPAVLCSSRRRRAPWPKGDELPSSSHEGFPCCPARPTRAVPSSPTTSARPTGSQADGVVQLARSSRRGPHELLGFRSGLPAPSLFPSMPEKLREAMNDPQARRLSLAGPVFPASLRPFRLIPGGPGSSASFLLTANLKEGVGRAGYTGEVAPCASFLSLSLSPRAL